MQQGGQMSGYQDLNVWQRAVELAESIYVLVANFPKFEQYALTSQMIRSSISIASNIAEGWGRNSRAEFTRFLSIAFGSACELETQLLIGKRVYKDLDFVVSEALLIEVKKMLMSLIKKQKMGT